MDDFWDYKMYKRAENMSDTKKQYVFQIANSKIILNILGFLYNNM